MDQTTENRNQKPDWFENFLSEYDYKSPKPGQLVEGTVIRQDDDGMLIDVGLKRDALIPAKDLSLVDESYLSNLNIGDQVIVSVLNRAVGDRELLVSLSKGIEHQSWETAEYYMQEGIIQNLEIIGYNRGGLIVKYETLRGFLPFSLVPEIHGVRSPKRAERIKNELVGKILEMKIIEVASQRNRLIFSAKAAQDDKRLARLQELEENQIISGRIVSIVDFGVFVDLDGVDGLVHISQLDWKKIKHPSEVLKVGDVIEVKVIGVDVERQRVSLSRKALLASPWETIAEHFKLGDYIEGRITRIVEFGAFVEIPIGVEGLIHISQVGYSSSQDPKSAIRPGEIVLMRILEIDPERKRVALSMRQVPLERQIAWAMEHLEEKDLIQQIGELSEGDSPSLSDVEDSKPEPVPLDQAVSESELHELKPVSNGSETPVQEQNNSPAHSHIDRTITSPAEEPEQEEDSGDNI